MKLNLFISSFIVAFSLINSNHLAQGTLNSQQLSGSNLNTITTAVPFLLITPDSRSGAMGDVGAAISPDANAIHWNPAKLVFIDETYEMGFSISYAPWLRALVNDINLAYLSGYKRIDRLSTVGASLRYFSLGNITFTDIQGTEIRDFKPNEFALDVVYSRLLSDNFSAGLTGRYVYSNLTGGISSGQGGPTKNFANSIATDLSLYYVSNSFDLAEKSSTIAFGTNISNIGAPMSYTDSAVSNDFLPANLRLGSCLNMELDEFNKISFAFDANKLLVPTPPIYKDGASNPPKIDDVASGRYPDIGVASGIFGSFTDAPGFLFYNNNGDNVINPDGSYVIEDGSKLKEELREVNLSFGMEFLYNNLFAIRGGYFHEHYTKGDRKFAAFGFGVKYQVINIDVSYVLPVNNRNSPLANTIRFSINFNLGENKTKDN